MGQDSVPQKMRFFGINQGLLVMGDFIHVYDFVNIIDRAEVALLMQATLNGAEQAGYTDGIWFLNYK